MTTDSPAMAESSKTAQRRARLVQSLPVTCGPCPTAILDPSSSNIVYLAPSSASYVGHLSTPVISATPPTPLAIPVGIPPGRQISISPSGRWIVVFHPHSSPGSSSTTESGTLSIYPSSILAATATAATSIPLASFSLPSAPLGVYHLYQPRQHTSQGRTPPQGPRAPPSYDARSGPAFVFLCSNGIYLCHPFHTINLSTNQPTWQMNLLQAPFHTRYHSFLGGPAPLDTGLRIRKGWIGGVDGNQAIWVGFETEGEARVVRVELRMDIMKQCYMLTTPLAPLPLCPSPPVPEYEKGASSVASELQGMIFVNLPSGTAPIVVKNEEGETPEKEPAGIERVGVVLLYRDEFITDSLARRQRSRLELCGLESRQVHLAEAFGDLESAGDVIPLWEWITLSSSLNTSVSPLDTTILAICPISSTTPGIAIAVCNTPEGAIISHLNMLSESRGEDTARWSALQGEAVALRNDLAPHDLPIILSQGAARGELGLVGLVSSSMGVTLVRSPEREGDGSVTDQSANAKNPSKRAATSIVLAIQQQADWSDVIRAAIGSGSPSSDLADAIIRESYALLIRHAVPETWPQLLRIQIAVFGATGDARRSIAVELFRLYEATLIFEHCALKGLDESSIFDLDSVWPLIPVTEWVAGIIGVTARETILEVARAEWDGVEALTEVTPRAMYIFHPLIRRMLLKLHVQLQTFIRFTSNLDRPLTQPRSDFLPLGISRDPRATILAKANVRDALEREGLDLFLWAKALSKGSQGDKLEKASMITSLLTLSPTPLLPLISESLQSIPTPSSLFTQGSEFEETEYDGITFEPFDGPAAFGGKVARCNRCSWRTGVLGNQGWNGTGLWGDWRRGWEDACGCGGQWVLDSGR